MREANRAVYLLDDGPAMRQLTDEVGRGRWSLTTLAEFDVQVPDATPPGGRWGTFSKLELSAGSSCPGAR
jgi:hypothetical protein